MPYLSIRNFKKSFNNLEVLKGISFDLEKGEVLSIIGSSGSGKTTLLRSINFLEKPEAGTMTLDGEVLFSAGKKAESEETLRQKRLNFGLVFQSFNLFPQYDVIKNITLAPELALKGEVKKFADSVRIQNSGLTLRERKRKIKEF